MQFLETAPAGSVLHVTLQRPERGNALNRALQQELAETWQAFEDDDELLVAVLHGAGDLFSIGHDVEELAHGRGAAASPIPESAIFPLNLHKPVIAAVEGPCYGLGLELALSCDLRVAAQGAMFGFPDQNLLVPYRIASVLLPRMTFIGESLDLLLSGAVLDAGQMRAARLVNLIAPAGQAVSVALQAASDMAVRFGRTAAFRKQQVWQLSGLPLPHAMAIARDPAPRG